MKKHLLMASILALSSEHVFAACDGTWISDTNNDYGTASNWSSTCVPSVSGDSSTFADIPVTTFSVSVPNINSPIISTLTFNAPSTDYTLIGAGPLSKIFLTSPNPALNILGGSQSFSIPLYFLNDGTINNNTTLTFNTSSNLGSLNSTVTLIGPGLLQNLSTTTFGFSPVGLVIDGGSVVNSGYMSFSLSPLSLVINDGSIENSGYMGISTGGTLVINGGRVTNTNYIGLSQSSITINGGSITNSYGFSVGSSGSLTALTINGGNIINAFGGSMGVTNAIVLNDGTVINESGASFAGSLTTDPDTFSTLQINGGELLNQGLIGPATFSMSGGTLINQGGVAVPTASVISLSGTGLIQGTGEFAPYFTEGAFTFENGGRVSPGNPTGTLAILSSGNYVQTPSGTLTINVINPTNYGSLNAFSASLNGTLQVVGLPGFDVPFNDPLQIIATTDGVAGIFKTVETIGLPNLMSIVTYDPDSVFITFTPTISSYLGHLYVPLFSLVTEANLFIDSRLDLLNRRVACFDECECPRRGNFYIGPLGGCGHVNPKGAQLGFNYYTFGALVGYDFAFDCFGLGAMADFERIEKNSIDLFGSLSMDHLHGSIYGNFFPLPDFEIIGVIGGSYDWIHLERKAGFFVLDEVERSNPLADLFDAFLGVEYTFYINDFKYMPYLEFTPIAALQFINFRIHSYRERNGIFFDFEFEHQKIRSLRSLLGIKANWIYETSCFSLEKTLNIGWQREYLDHQRTIRFTPVNVVGPSSTLSISGIGRDSVVGGIDLLCRFNSIYSLEASGEFEVNSLYYNLLFYVGGNVAF